jgi:hypothetical protein
MANGQSLLDAVKEYFNPAVTQKMSSLAGATPQNTNRAINGIVPALLSGAATLAGSREGAGQLMDLIRLQTNDGKILSNLTDKLSGGNATEDLMSSGRDIVARLFGRNLNSVIDALARSIGINSSTIGSLLSMAAPVVLGALGRERSARGLGADGLASLLTGQKSFLAQMLPAGLTSLIGSDNNVWGTEERAAAPRRYEEPRASYGPVSERRSDWWLFPLLALAALGLLLYSFWPRRATVPEEPVAKQEVPVEPSRPPESAPAPQAPALIEKEAPRIAEVARVARQDETIEPRSGDTSLAASQSVRAARETVTGAGPQNVRRAQEALRSQGQDPGPIDGIMGPRTRRALREFQKANGLQQTGTLDAETQEKLAYGR